MSAQGNPAVPVVEARPADSAYERVGRAGHWLAEAGLPFALILYLSLKGGGYADVVYEEVGWVIWWFVLLGVLVGVLPLARVGLGARLGLGFMAAFVVWTGLGIGWSQSAEQSATELARVATYLSIFVFMVLARRPGSARRTVNAVAAAIAVIGAMALMQRFHPSLFPANEAGRVLDNAQSRLNYPLNYWNGLAALIAMGIPLLVTIAGRARTLAGQRPRRRGPARDGPHRLLHALSRRGDRDRGRPRRADRALSAPVRAAADARLRGHRRRAADRGGGAARRPGERFADRDGARPGRDRCWR